MGYKTKFELLAVSITEYFICEDAKRAWLQDPGQLSPDKRFEEYARITDSIRDKKEEIKKILKEFYEREERIKIGDSVSDGSVLPYLLR